MSKTEKEYKLDITDQICPMTFVRTKLLIEKMPSGAMAAVRLKGAEPIQNVPRSIREHGHKIISMELEDHKHPGGPHIIIFKKA